MFFKKKLVKINRNKSKFNLKFKKIIIKNDYIKLFCFDKFLFIFKNNINLVLIDFFSKDFNILFFILNNFISNLFNFYKKILIIFGVGSKFFLKKHNLYLYLGFSHPKVIFISVDFIIEVKDKQIILYSINKQRLFEFSNYLKKFKIPDLYKGKGIKFLDETIKLKNVKKK